MLRKMGEWRKTSEYVWPTIEWICSGKASSRSWSEKKWTGMLRNNTHFAPNFWEWTGMLRNNSEFLLILSILLSIYGRTDIKKSLFCTSDCWLQTQNAERVCSGICNLSISVNRFNLTLQPAVCGERFGYMHHSILRAKLQIIFGN